MKYTMNILKVTLLAFLVTFWSCMDLEEVPLTRISPASYYQTPEQCMSIIVSAAQLVVQDHPGYADGSQRTQLNWNIRFQNSVWNNHYRSINNLNPVIKVILDGNLDSYDKNTVNDILGQAYFLRAFNHFQLVRLYGKILYLDEDYPDLVANPPTPESREEISVVYDKIEADLLKAQEIIGKNANPAIPNVWAVKSLLARVYINRATAPLNQADYYAKARDAAEDVLTNSPYSFEPKITEIFNIANKNKNQEYIWTYNSADDNPRGNGQWPGPDEWDVWGAHDAEGLWADRFPNQPRKWYYVLSVFPSNLYDDEDDWDWLKWGNSEDTRPFQAKFMWPNVPREIHENNDYYHPVNPVFRYTELLLIYAEAANKANGGPTQLAVDRLNMVIDRGNAPFPSPFDNCKNSNAELNAILVAAHVSTSIAGTEPQATMSMSVDEFDKRVITEREWELCFEKESYFDVLRKRRLQEQAELNLDKTFEEYRYLFPIPAADVSFIGQNPGYLVE